MPPVGGVLAVTQPYGAALGQQLPFVAQPPGANTNLAVTIDGYGLYRLLSLVLTLTADSNAANRYVTVEYQGQAGSAYAVGSAAVVVTASSTQRFVGDAYRGEGEWAANTDVLFKLPNVFLSPGDTLAVIVANKQAGDTLTAIRGVWERFPFNADVLPNVSP